MPAWLPRRVNTLGAGRFQLSAYLAIHASVESGLKFCVYPQLWVSNLQSESGVKNLWLCYLDRHQCDVIILFFFIHRIVNYILDDSFYLSLDRQLTHQTSQIWLDKIDLISCTLPFPHYVVRCCHRLWITVSLLGLSVITRLQPIEINAAAVCPTYSSLVASA